MEEDDETASVDGSRQCRSTFSHYLPRLRSEFYRADAMVFWTLPVFLRANSWLSDRFLGAFREILLHASAREGLLCPAYCLMPDYQHLVWMGLRSSTDQRRAMRFLRTELGPHLHPAKFQHQPYDHVLTAEERQADRLSLACADYVFLNPFRAGLVDDPGAWRYSGALIPGYPRVDPFRPGYWEWVWKRYAQILEPGIQNRILPPRQMA